MLLTCEFIPWQVQRLSTHVIMKRHLPLDD